MRLYTAAILKHIKIRAFADQRYHQGLENPCFA